LKLLSTYLAVDVVVSRRIGVFPPRKIADYRREKFLVVMCSFERLRRIVDARNCNRLFPIVPRRKRATLVLNIRLAEEHTAVRSRGKIVPDSPWVLTTRAGRAELRVKEFGNADITVTEEVIS
jgi:hypothetical protein